VLLNLLKGIHGKYEGVMFIVSKELGCISLTKKIVGIACNLAKLLA
jgi:hypothetical protein